MPIRIRLVAAPERISSRKKRVAAVQAFRLKSTAAPTKKAAATPSVFFYLSQPNGEYIAIPEVSSERRRYIPIALLPPAVIASNKLYLITSSDLYLLGVLSSLMHMAWVKVVAGRLESRFQYSASMVYNTFPWPEQISEKQKIRIRAAAHEVLAMRRKLGDGRHGFLPSRSVPKTRQVSLADLYDVLSMPPELVKAHRTLDRAVDRAYRKTPFHNDRDRVEHLFAQYEKLTAPLLPATPKIRAKRGSAAKPRTPRTRPS